MPEDWLTLHYRTNDKIVHVATLLYAGRAWCSLRCDNAVSFETAKGEVQLPVTCLTCLAVD